SQQRIQRSGTSARQRPAKTENQSAPNISPTEFFRLDFNFFSIDGFRLELLDQENGSDSHRHRTHHQSIHVKSLEAEHFLNAKPRNSFRLDQDDSEKSSCDKIF